MDMPKHIQGRATHQMGKKRLSPNLFVFAGLSALGIRCVPAFAGCTTPSCKLRLAGYSSAMQTDLALFTHKVL